MRAFDMSPLYRLSVGYDKLDNLFDALSHFDELSVAYPPYDIVKLDEDTYRISMAVAGFTEDELDLVVENNELKISGSKKDVETKQEGAFLHQGIATRTFKRTFNLADYIRVDGATLENGLLHVTLVREMPEHMKPRSIEIGSNAAPKALSGKKAH